MKLSIVVLNYKTKNLVKYFLKKVLSFNFDFKWEIIVVDNASQDGLGKLLKEEFPVIKFIQNKKNTGMGAGNNLGINQSTGEYILIVNPDITLNQLALQELVKFLDTHPDSAIAAPQILNPDKTLQDTCYRWPHVFTFIYRRTFLGQTKKGKQHLYYYTYHDCDLSQAQQVNWVLGGCFLIRRQALIDVGLFDENFFLFLEDTDLCQRLWQKKWYVWYIPAAKVIHLPHRLSSGHGSFRDIFSRIAWVHLMSWLKYFWKWRKNKN